MISYENTSYSQKLHIPANTCHNQEFLIRSSFQIQLSTSNSWSFLPIPELQISHGWPNDHLQSLNKCKAEFLHLCTLGIIRKCRNSWSFLPIPELQISYGWLSDHLQSLNKCKAEFRNLCTSGITRKCRNSCLFRNYKYLMDS